eukprot:1157977-Pelagomonas_calceolata.AAC.3
MMRHKWRLVAAFFKTNSNAKSAQKLSIIPSEDGRAAGSPDEPERCWSRSPSVFWQACQSDQARQGCSLSTRHPMLTVPPNTLLNVNRVSLVSKVSHVAFLSLFRA